jgi:hypothetical protein
MPENGDICTKFGVYRSLCCNHELVMREGDAFPDCPRHKKLPTIWKTTDAEINPAKLVKKTKSDPAA